MLDNEKDHLLPRAFGVEVFRCQVGSRVHGVSVSDDDRDEMGMCIEPPEYLVGLKKVMSENGVLRDFGQYIYRTQAEGVRSGYGDLDLTVYSLRKWVRLALQGNPTVLLPLFVPPSEIVVSSDVSEDLRSKSDRFLSRHTADRFLGYMLAQREQMLGLRGKKHTNRPELIQQYGFDTKFAYHMCRLGFQGVELLSTGRITLPIPEPQRAWLLGVRRGERTMAETIDTALDLESQLKQLQAGSSLPGDPNYEWADEWLIETYEMVWAR